MELNWLKYFYEVARAQSVTQASIHLRISQPAVTKIVRQLEGQLGYKLFAKSGRNIRLTSEGNRLYQHCIPIFKKLEQMKNLSQVVDRKWKGALRFGASDNLSNYVLPGVMRELDREIPLADWAIYTGSSKEIKARVLTGELDFGLFYTELALSEQGLLAEEKVAEVPFVAVCSSHAGRTMSLLKLRKLKMTYVGVRFADYSNTLPEQWMVKTLKIPYSRNIQANSKETQKQIVVAGLGFGIFPHFMVKRELKDKSLTLISGTERPLTLRVVRRTDEPLTIASQLLIKAVKNAL